MLPSTRFRTMYLPEDADDGRWLWAVLPEDEEPYEDALDHAVPIAEPIPDWHCECGTHQRERRRLNCVYCGVGREDV